MGKTAKEYADERRAKGLCCSCSSAALPGKTRCEACTKVASDKAKARYIAKKASGLCVACQKTAPLDQMTLCFQCNEIANDRRKREPKPEKPPDDRTIYQKRIEAGRCQNCPALALPDKKRCQACHERYKLKRQARRAAGLCLACNKPADGKANCSDCRLKFKARIISRIDGKRCVDCNVGLTGSDKRCEPCLAKDNLKTRRNRRKLRNETFAAYGGYQCKCCPVDEPWCLEIDHVNNDGAAHRRKLFGKQNAGSHRFYRWLKSNGYPAGFQVLCANCNKAKHKFGKCPHQMSEAELDALFSD